MNQKLNASPHTGLEVTEGGRVNVYVDGSCSYNGCAKAIAGIGIWFGDSNTWNTSKTLKKARAANIVAETLAATEAIKICKEKDIQKLRIINDSQYLIDCALQYMGKWKENGWRNAKKQTSDKPRATQGARSEQGRDRRHLPIHPRTSWILWK
ncbi:ribonuclease H1-like [Diachasma alloeum]|uniref:ribonuclease H1-like n=1 Tax=Diachasma alloeum TaxID=454923 RepID=UPI0007382335|nr:ribonuclease H1-like [Diachasma alloeum]